MRFFSSDRAESAFNRWEEMRLNPPVDHSDVCRGCRECSKIKIFSKMDLIEPHNITCYHQDREMKMRPIKCVNHARTVSDVGFDADDEQRQDLALCSEHDYKENVKYLYLQEFHRG